MIQLGAGNPTWLTLGWVIALIVLVLDIVLVAVGQLDLKLGLLIGGLSLSRLL